VVLVDHVRPVLVALVRQVPAERLVQALVAVQVSLAQVALQALAAEQAFRVPAAVAAQRVAVVAARAAEQLVLSVKAAAAVKARLASRSVRNAKSLNKEAPRALVAQLCHVATAARAFACAEVLAFKISLTRLMAMPVS
jgi:hypothetical protein